LQLGWKWGFLGGFNSRSNAQGLLPLLLSLEANNKAGKKIRLILNGDTLDAQSLEWLDLNPREQECIVVLRRLHAAGAEVAVINGNHDPDIAHLKRVLQLPIIGKEYFLEQDHYSVFITHGDQFERQKKSLVWVGDMFVSIFTILNKIKWLFKMPPYKKHAAEMKDKALASIKQTSFRAILIGHNHYASLAEEGGKIYGNSGCVVAKYPLNFIKITPGGQIMLMQYLPTGKFITIKELSL